jgi:hypothetical protein
MMAGTLLTGRFRIWQESVGPADLENDRDVVGSIDLENGGNVVGPVDLKFMAGKLLNRICLKYTRESFWAGSF